jgi:hypothetical protein
MDPITAALIAAVAKLAEPAIKDAYQGLKSLIVKKLGAQHQVVSAVESLEQKPDSTGRQQTLQEEVKTAGVENDDEILTAARSLIEKVKATPGGGDHVRQTVTGNQNIFSGTGDINIGGRQT